MTTYARGVVIRRRSASKPAVRSSIGSPDQWREAAARWQALGATHVTFYTSGQGWERCRNRLTPCVSSVKRYAEEGVQHETHRL
jgi:hypothetical protein